MVLLRKSIWHSEGSRLVWMQCARARRYLLSNTKVTGPALQQHCHGAVLNANYLRENSEMLHA